MLEIVFPRFQISKFSGGHDPGPPRKQPILQQSDFGLDAPLVRLTLMLGADVHSHVYSYAGDDNTNAMLGCYFALYSTAAMVNYVDTCCMLNAIATAIDVR